MAEIVWRETMSCAPGLSMHTVRQIRTSSESVGANIAEGNRRTPKEFRRYLNIALGSANETDSHLVTLMNRGLIDLRIALQVRDDLATLKRMIIALQKTLL
ncbi:hypothetical protein GEMMAAP_15410 [Gemmatimonas phototrophica]|uniref:Four helix bundle protein n=1 Tax=Gemmatimonas phototrophica TaxID=1379270 RepID=A0A143BQP0_9BACT|nr:hypothetical protein GEMMAAP_15410 [Gemmatimonas phototrophica]